MRILALCMSSSILLSPNPERVGVEKQGCKPFNVRPPAEADRSSVLISAKFRKTPGSSLHCSLRFESILTLNCFNITAAYRNANKVFL
mmetsp:Transcript_3961/g.8405  ORF Transcript_3961/g.8405 Transcript_3961/m.8405 type:complete len:88 (-) Transcript_3961:208-471(-)